MKHILTDLEKLTLFKCTFTQFCYATSKAIITLLISANV